MKTTTYRISADLVEKIHAAIRERKERTGEKISLKSWVESAAKKKLKDDRLEFPTVL